MATHTHSDNDAPSNSDASEDNLRWIYNEQFRAILHDDDQCDKCEDWKDHYTISKDVGHASMLEAHRAHDIAVQQSFESRLDSLEREHGEMLEEMAALEQELKQVQMEIEEVQKDQVSVTNSNLERKY